MSRFTLFDPANLPDPEYGAPDPAKVIEGDPHFTVWTLEDRGDGRTYAGYWASTTGAWKVSYDEWEYCTLVEGRAIISEDGGDFWDLKPGQHFIFRPGFTGKWHVIEPVIKTFVVILP